MAGKGPLFLLDGNSLVFRAFFALPTDLATTGGQVTNAVLGFSSIFVNLLRDHDPSGVAVAFDRPEPTFRDDVVPDYKGNRPEMPDLLAPQFALVRDVLDVLGVVRVEKVGYEADDVLATLATQARDAGRDVVVVSGDRDTFQLVEDPHVKVMYTRRGISDTVVYDEAGIVERYGVPPPSYPLLAALRGDSSDNLPGVPGVGDKTAAKLVTQYGDLDQILEHAGDLTPKLRQSLLEHEDQVRANALVTPLVRDVALEVGIDDFGLGQWDVTEVRRVFSELELRSVWQRLAPILSEDPDEPLARSSTAPAAIDVDLGAVEVLPVHGSAASEALARSAETGALLALLPWWIGDPGRSRLLGLAVARVEEDDSSMSTTSSRSAKTTKSSKSSKSNMSALWLDEEALADSSVVGALSELLGPGGARVVAHGAKELMRSLLPQGVDVCGLEMDTAVAAYLLDPSSGRYKLEEVLDSRLGLTLGESAAAPAGQLDLSGTQEGESSKGAAQGAVAVGLLVGPLRAALESTGLERLHDEVERPLVRVLARMEVKGIRVDAAELRRIMKDLVDECSALEAEVQRLAGESFNVNSTLQLRTVLYEHLGLTPGRKTKTGFSTDAATLEKLRGQHPIVDVLLRYREVEKLRSTYGESLLAEVAHDGRIHATFQQTVARTGRLSSDRPNLHNIPVRTDEGRQLRRAFVPDEGHVLLVCDYDQIELRVIAHLSEDPGLVSAFAEKRDVHRATAAQVFGVPPEGVTPAQRNRAKMVSYGLAYGMEAYGLARRLSIETAEAQGILDAYFAAFPAVRAYMDSTVAQARSKGYTETLFGRRRPLPDLNSPNRNLRMAAERQAMNAGIQGLAADLFKVALVRLDSALSDAGLAARLVLQVHDEVIVEVPDSETEAVGDLVPPVMADVSEVVGLAVPLEVSSAWGTSWADAKS
ncbi:MAG TPA: DNA polymerase I [Acidimicrobiales bacterium]|nr:DNA polymerase I [Acidimicrobiales bacterium]